MSNLVAIGIAICLIGSMTSGCITREPKSPREAALKELRQEKKKPGSSDALARLAASVKRRRDVRQQISRYKETISNKLGAPNTHLSEWRGKKLRIIVSMRLDASGNIEKLDIKESSGNEKFDNDASRFIRAGAPFSPPPIAIAGTNFLFEIANKAQ